jgi:hypothetical protein
MPSISLDINEANCSGDKTIFMEASGPLQPTILPIHGLHGLFHPTSYKKLLSLVVFYYFIRIKPDRV